MVTFSSAGTRNGGVVTGHSGGVSLFFFVELFHVDAAFSSDSASSSDWVSVTSPPRTYHLLQEIVSEPTLISGRMSVRVETQYRQDRNHN